MQDSAAPRHFVTALARGLEILRCFDRPRAELTVSDVARRTGLSQPTAWRLCQTLLDCGYLVRSTTGAGMRVGAPALTLGYVAVSGQTEVELSLPYMRQITDATGVGTTLSVRRGMEIISVEQCNGLFVQPNQSNGWRAPIVSVASGLSVLAALPSAARETIMAELARHDAAWPKHLARIEASVQALSDNGFVQLDGMLKGEYIGIAVPLFAPGTDPADQWVLSAGELTGRWTPEGTREVAEALMRAADILRPALATRI